MGTFAGFESIISALILAIVLCMFVMMFAFMVFSFMQWRRTLTYRPPPLRLEEYACPKCGSKELEQVGRRTVRCRKCGTTFTIGVEAAEERWIMWPFFWWFPFPILWPVPVRDNNRWQGVEWVDTLEKL
ncbi:MAG: hypothetical protein ACUVQY_10825 [Thermoproteota archaeon]